MNDGSVLRNKRKLFQENQELYPTHHIRSWFIIIQKFRLNIFQDLENENITLRNRTNTHTSSGNCAGPGPKFSLRSVCPFVTALLLIINEKNRLW